MGLATYCFDALMKDRFVNEVEFAEFPDEFNVAKHLDLGDGTLLLLLRSKRVVMFVIDCEQKEGVVIGWSCLEGGGALKVPCLTHLEIFNIPNYRNRMI